MKYLRNWFYNKKIISLTAEEAIDLPNPFPQHSHRSSGTGYDTRSKRDMQQCQKWHWGGRRESLTLEWAQIPRRETAASLAQTDRKCLNHQSALFPTSEFVLQGRIHEKGFTNWKDNWKERGRFIHCRTSEHPFKDVPEDRRIPTGCRGGTSCPQQHWHTITLQHSQK